MTERTFIFHQLDHDGNVVEVRVPEHEIYEDYYPIWKDLMEKKFGPESELITFENCLEDWKAVHWAGEIYEESY